VYDFNLITRNRVAALAATALLVAACGGGTTPTPSPVATQAAPSTAPSAAASEAPSAEASDAAEAYEVELGDNDKLGKFLTGEDGKTLYLFTPDADGKSACNAGCIDSWPAFTIEDGETVTGGDGVTGTFGTITRDDGSTQVTYAGHPLYYFTGDQAAGDVNGQGLGSKWYVVGADGNAIMKTAASGGGRY
jgi:predicted lipoprotein with Yx(FWY)xxD motif